VSHPASVPLPPASTAASVAPRRSTLQRQALLSTALVVGIVAALVVIAGLGFETLSSARAYVGGEGLWAKAQKDAVYRLTRYAYTQDPAEYTAFERHLEVYRGDRQARLELLGENTNWDRVHEGFLQGRNHPDDVHRMGVFLQRYRGLSFIEEAIAIWEAGDSLMLELEGVGRALQQRVLARQLTEPTRAALLADIDRLTLELTRLEDAFSSTMGAGSRWAARTMLGALIVAAVLLLAFGAVILRDATRRLRASEQSLQVVEAQLRQAQKMEAVGQLTGGIAHDFNNILTIILSNVRLLEDRLPADATGLRADLRELKLAAKRGGEMIHKLLAFSRAEPLRFEPNDLGHLLHESIQILRHLLPASIQLEVQADPTTPAARTDPAAFEQMVLNLATNARDGMPEGGRLGLSLLPAEIDDAFVRSRGWGRRGRYAALRVRDSGVGMPADVQRRLFEPFFTTKPVGQGSGLGMPMVYGLMKQHGGFVDVESAPGVGTTVTLYFPASEPAPARPVPPPSPPPPSGGTILLVEDEPALRRAAQRILERHQFDVITAADGEEALDLFDQHQSRIGLVLSDVVMPRLGGPALHARLRAGGSQVPFLFMSGYPAREMPDGVPLPPDVPLLPKPWDPRELVAHVAALIARR
jgi:signal transduction histidine kinase/CheY-like chemotaxis protein